MACEETKTVIEMVIPSSALISNPHPYPRPQETCHLTKENHFLEMLTFAKNTLNGMLWQAYSP